MSKQSLLALGIPTYKRPGSVIKIIEHALNLNIFDQIIISSNSNEEELNQYLENKNSSIITFHQQINNVGISKNYTKLIEICECQYLHIVSDEDYIDGENLKTFYSFLEESDELSLIILSVTDIDGNIYKDATWQTNKYLKDSLGETAHIGSTVINTKCWNNNSFKIMREYCDREKGDVYPTTAAALISYSSAAKLKYLPEHLVQMGAIHDFSEIGGHKTYGTLPKLEQFISILVLLRSLIIPRKIYVYLYIFYYFGHHGLQQSSQRFNEKPLTIIRTYIRNNNSKLIYQIALYFLLLWYYYFLVYYHVKGQIGNKLRRYNLR